MIEVESDADHNDHPSDLPLSPDADHVDHPLSSDADHDDHPSVHALLRQRLQKAGLGAPKPPKKIRRLQL